MIIVYRNIGGMSQVKQLPIDFKIAHILDALRVFNRNYSNPAERGELIRRGIDVQKALNIPIDNYRHDYFNKMAKNINRYIEKSVENFAKEHPGEMLNAEDVDAVLEKLYDAYHK